MSEKQSWGISYFDQHGERHGCGIGVVEPPAFMQATEWKSQKALRYYADKERTELEQRYEQLEQVARDLYNSAWTSEFLRMCAEMPHADRELKERVADGWLQNEREKLRELGVSLDD